jgi:hypothetical protein
MNLFNTLLVFHIAGGSIGLLTGSIVMMLKKGDKNHVRLGNIYFYSLLLSAIVSFPMSYLHSNWFLFIVGVFTSYMLLTGKSYLDKRTSAEVKVTDWILAGTMLLFGLGFLGIGLLNVFKGVYFGIVLIVFGGISLSFVLHDWANFTGRARVKNFWLTTHLQRMIGSYIASATAFIVVNNHVIPGVIAWLLPTIVLTPLIGIWTKKYMVKAD